MERIKEIMEIPLSNLVIGKGQVRIRDVGKDIDELAESIKKIGLLRTHHGSVLQKNQESRNFNRPKKISST